MKYKWLNKKNNNKLIIFFNGWGMDECVVNHLLTEDYDILMFYDYNSLNTDFDFKSIDIYSQKYLIAWSMGVMIATLFNNVNYDKKIAINGTFKPIDDNYGIPKRIYNLTLKNFSQKGAEKFIKNMFDNSFLPHPDPLLKKRGESSEIESEFNFSNFLLQLNRDFENQKSELEALTHYEANPNFKYDKVILSSNDKIIPTKNQAAFWNIKPNVEGGHAPFFNFSKWSDLL